MRALGSSGSWIAVALATIALVATGVAARAGAGAAPRTNITVWAAGAFGGAGYGGFVPAGALVTEQREVDVAGGELQLAGVAATIDPGSVQLRDLTDPDAAILEQRFVPGAATPTELLARHLGEPVTAVTQKGEVAGTLRAVDDQVVVIETGTGDQRRLQLLRRDGFVQDLRVAATTGATGDAPSLSWRIRSAKPGLHKIEVGYRADGMTWSASYLGVLDDAGKALELSARATIKNSTGARYDAAMLTLVRGGAQPAAGMAASGAAPARYPLPAPLRLGPGDAVQVELMPRRTAKVRSVIGYESITDPSAAFQATPGSDCSQQNGSEGEAGHAEIALELDVPGTTALPDGLVRLFRRRATGAELIAEGAMHAGPGVARIRVGPAPELTGERHATRCTYDEHARTVRETIEVKLANKAKQPADVVVREYLWRWPIWHLEAEDRKGVRAGPQTQEYRVRVPAGGTQQLTYTVVYAW